jgi:hypothetical protein
MWLPIDMDVILLKRKWLANYHLFDVESNLLVVIYVHNILPPLHFHLVLSFIIPCTLVHLSKLVGSICKMWLLVLQICKLDGLS